MITATRRVVQDMNCLLVKKLNEVGDPGLRTINMGALLTLLTALLLDMVKIRLPRASKL